MADANSVTAALATLGASGWVVASATGNPYGGARQPGFFYASQGAVTAPLDLNQNVLGSFTLPGGVMGKTGRLKLFALVNNSSASGNMTYWFRIAGVDVMATVFGSGFAGAYYEQIFANLNSESVNAYPNSNTTNGPVSSGMVQTAINTSIAQTVQFVGAKSVAGDVMSCLYFGGEVFKA